MDFGFGLIIEIIVLIIAVIYIIFKGGDCD